MLCLVCFHQILDQISSLWSLLYYSCSHPVLLLVFYSTSLLLLSYHTMSIPCLISVAIYLPALYACVHDTVFQCMFMIRIYRYTCVYICTPLGIQITTRWRVLTFLDPHVQVSELALTWILLLRIKLTLRSGQASYSSSPFLAPPGWLAASPANSGAPFCTVHTYIYPCILTIAPIGEVIFL